MQLLNAARIIYLYERSVQKPAEDSWMTGRTEYVDGQSVLKLRPRRRFTHQELFHRAAQCRDYLRFGEEVDACLSDSIRRYTSLMVRSNTPEVWREVGMEDVPWLHGIAHVRDEVHLKSEDNHHWHGLEVSRLKRLPELLDEPCVIIDNREGKDGIVCVVNDLDCDRLPIVVPVNPKGHGVYQGVEIKKVNFALSVYGHSHADWLINTAAREDRVLFIDHEKTRRLMSCAGLQLSRACMSLPDRVIIRQSAKIVNTSKSLGGQPRVADLEEELRNAAMASEGLKSVSPVSQGLNLMRQEGPDGCR